MQVLCDFQLKKGYVACKHCRTRMPRTEPDKCFAACKRPGCAHLGGATGDIAEVVVITCNKTLKERSYPIHACGLFGECLPHYRCSRESKEALAEWVEKEGREVEVHTCRGCEKWQPTEQPSTPIIERPSTE